MDARIIFIPDFFVKVIIILSRVENYCHWFTWKDIWITTAEFHSLAIPLDFPEFTEKHYVY